jgi:S1-C subfamily serine protease
MSKKLLQTLLTVGIAAGFFGMGIKIVTAESSIWKGDAVGYSVGSITVTRPPHWACRDSDEKLIYFDGRQANMATEDQARTAKPEQVWCDKEQLLLFAYLRKAYALISSAVLTRSHPLSPVEVFQKVSPSVFVVEALDENGKTLVLGSAVAVAPDFLITNCHVVQSGSSLKVSRGKENWTAKLIEAAPNHDLCGLRLSGLTLQVVEVRPSSKLAIGERVYAIGSPEGLELTFSEGVISSLRDTEGVHMIQTSAPISPGSSGGGLFDTHGNLVGITTFYLKEGQSLNFALPGEWVTEVLARSSATALSALSDATLESAAWIDIGLDAVKKEDYDLALHSFSKCVALKESDAYRAWFEIGKIWGKAGLGSYFASSAYNAWFGSRIDSNLQEAQTKAASALERTIQLRPDYAEAWRELATTYMGEHKMQQALDAAKEAARLNPRNRENWWWLGFAYTKVNSYKEAIDAWQQALHTPLNNSSALDTSDATLSLQAFSVEAPLSAWRRDASARQVVFVNRDLGVERIGRI